MHDIVADGGIGDGAAALTKINLAAKTAHVEHFGIGDDVTNPLAEKRDIARGKNSNPSKACRSNKAATFPIRRRECW